MYCDYVKINKNFQASINLELDLNNDKKIAEYIPTSDICDVLKQYIDAIIGKNGDRATTLVGPYGKGKSFLLLTLLYLISTDSKSQTYVQLKKKIKATDKELAASIQELNSKHIKLMPVIINSNYNDLTQAFQLAINDALEREEITSIVPDTVFSVCLGLLKKWESDPEIKNKAYKKCQAINEIDVKELKNGLKNYSEEAYKQFHALYNCISNGLDFNPLVNSDITKMYIDVDHKLCEHGYTGMFIVFDEFSKFIENEDNCATKDLKIIQDFAEISTRSNDIEQMHICCVTHKSLELYSYNGNRKDQFKTIEGRFKEIKFNRSLEENYQIISAAIDNSKAGSKAEKYIKLHEALYNAIGDSPIYAGLENSSGIFSECYPMNPMTIFVLIQLSEMVAQNERTLFTFLSDTDENSFNSFLHKNNDGLLNTDTVYDYFCPILKREETNSIRNIWYRAEGILSRLADPQKRSVIKTLALIQMINDYDKLPSDEKTIALCMGANEGQFESILSELIEDHYLRRSVLTNSLSFASVNSKEIEEQINLYLPKVKTIEVDAIADEINDEKYLIPRKFNEERKITRFFRVHFITDEQLMELSSFKVFEDKAFSDGIVFNVLHTHIQSRKIKEKVESINDSKVVVRYSKEQTSKYYFESLHRYAALKEMLGNRENDEIVRNEINLLIDEVTEDIRKMNDSYFYENCDCYSSVCKSTKLNTLLSESMSITYPKQVIFNNELVNKNVVTKQYQKSINHVIDYLLSENSEFNYSETSPESTIWKTVIGQIGTEHPDTRETVEEIKSYIISSEGKKAPISELVVKYRSAPYGIRHGVLPLLFAFAISELSDNIVLYYQNVEIDLSSDNLVKATYSPENYYFGFQKGSKAQLDYLNKLSKLFSLDQQTNFRHQTRDLSEELRKYFLGLPQLIRSANAGNHYLEIPESILLYKNKFYSYSINPFEVVFTTPLEIFGDYSSAYDELKKFKNNESQTVNEFKAQIANTIRSNFGIDKHTSLKMGMNKYLKSQEGETTPILNDKDYDIYAAISKNLSYDNSEAANSIAKATVGMYMEDWDKDYSQKLVEGLDNFRKHMKSTKRVNKNMSIDEVVDQLDIKVNSMMGKVLERNINNLINEYGDSVSKDEKIAIIAKLLKKNL